MDAKSFIAARVAALSMSGIRRIFDLAATMKDPIDFSMGQPDFPVPEPVKATAIEALSADRNGYALTYGIPELRARIRQALADEFGWEAGDESRGVIVTSGVSGALLLIMMAILNPDEEVIVPDPYFVSYPHLAGLAGGRSVPIDNQPTFAYAVDRLEAAVTPRTKAILLNSPSNPTGVVYSAAQVQDVCAFAARHNLLIISDEIYNLLSFDGRPASPAGYAPERTILIRGFGKSYGMTGWRMGFATGPAAIIAEMAKLQQYTYVCQPQPFQRACITALDTDVSHLVAAYAKKRDLAREIMEQRFEFPTPGGGFFLYCRAPKKFATGTAFVEAAVKKNVLTVPGAAFSRHDTHFRISYAVPNDKLEQGCRILCDLAD